MIRERKRQRAGRTPCPIPGRYRDTASAILRNVFFRQRMTYGEDRLGIYARGANSCQDLQGLSRQGNRLQRANLLRRTHVLVRFAGELRLC